MHFSRSFLFSLLRESGKRRRTASRDPLPLFLDFRAPAFPRRARFSLVASPWPLGAVFFPVCPRPSKPPPSPCALSFRAASLRIFPLCAPPHSLSTAPGETFSADGANRNASGKTPSSSNEVSFQASFQQTPSLPGALDALQIAALSKSPG